MSHDDHRGCACSAGQQRLTEAQLFMAYGLGGREVAGRIRRMLDRRTDPPRTATAIAAHERLQELRAERDPAIAQPELRHLARQPLQRPRTAARPAGAAIPVRLVSRP